MKNEAPERIIYDNHGIVIARDRLNYVVYDKVIGRKGKSAGKNRLANATFHGNIAQACIESATRTSEVRASREFREIAELILKGQKQMFDELRGNPQICDS